MIDGPFRSWLPSVTRPLIAVYGGLKLTPNAISLASAFIAMGAAYLCAQDLPMAALVAWWSGRLLDGTDGIYARATGQTSDFGAYLDIVCDMASYSVMILGFSFLHPQYQTLWSIVLLLYVLCITSALALGSLEQKIGVTLCDNRGLRLSVGLAEGGETGLAYSAFLLFPGFLSFLLPIWIGVLAITVIARTLLAYRMFRAQNSPNSL